MVAHSSFANSNNGAKNVYAADNYCEGGHGASLGSFGSGGSVASASNITFTRFTMVDSLYGGRFKSWSGGNGLVSDVSSGLEARCTR